LRRRRWPFHPAHALPASFAAYWQACGPAGDERAPLGSHDTLSPGETDAGDVHAAAPAVPDCAARIVGYFDTGAPQTGQCGG
jgi:hypothetical protein